MVSSAGTQTPSDPPISRRVGLTHEEANSAGATQKGPTMSDTPRAILQKAKEIATAAIECENPGETDVALVLAQIAQTYALIAIAETLLDMTYVDSDHGYRVVRTSPDP